MDREKVLKGLECHGKGGSKGCLGCPYELTSGCQLILCHDALELLKEQEKKQIILQKKHIITWGRNDEFSMRKLYEAICETLLDEGELIIARTDDNEKVEFVFYVVND